MAADRWHASPIAVIRTHTHNRSKQISVLRVKFEIRGNYINSTFKAVVVDSI